MSLQKTLSIIENKFPHVYSWLMKLSIEYLVPANRRMGIKIESMIPGNQTIILRLPYRRKNFNVGGTVHGSAIMALAETVHGVAVLTRFKPDNHFMFTKEINLKYLKKATSELFVRFNLGQQILSKIENELNAHGIFELELESTVTDTSEASIAQLKAVYHIKRKSHKTS